MKNEVQFKFLVDYVIRGTFFEISSTQTPRVPALEHRPSTSEKLDFHVFSARKIVFHYVNPMRIACDTDAENLGAFWQKRYYHSVEVVPKPLLPRTGTLKDLVTVR